MAKKRSKKRSPKTTPTSRRGSIRKRTRTVRGELYHQSLLEENLDIEISPCATPSAIILNETTDIPPPPTTVDTPVLNNRKSLHDEILETTISEEFVDAFQPMSPHNTMTPPRVTESVVTDIVARDSIVDGIRESEESGIVKDAEEKENWKFLNGIYQLSRVRPRVSDKTDETKPSR